MAYQPRVRYWDADRDDKGVWTITFELPATDILLLEFTNKYLKIQYNTPNGVWHQWMQLHDHYETYQDLLQGMRVRVLDEEDPSGYSYIEPDLHIDEGGRLKGNKHDNVLVGSTGDDILIGKLGDDILHGDDISKTVWLAGNDKLFGGGGNDTAYGYRGDDILYGGSGSDKLHGGHGQDQLFGGGGQDTLYGGYGHDTLFGGKSSDTLYGNDGNDDLYGDGGNDKLHGGKGNDILDGGWERTPYMAAMAMTRLMAVKEATSYMAAMAMTHFMAVTVQIYLFSKDLMALISAIKSWILKLALIKLEYRPIGLMTDGYR